MPNKHALLSASGAHRWLNCTPSALLEAEKEDRETEASKEGTLAHALCEHKLLKHLKNLEHEKPEGTDEDMERHGDDYLSYVTEQFEKAKETCEDPVLLIEAKVDFSRVVPEGFGTADCLLIAEPYMHVIDFKYGQGVVVDAIGNPQMRLYALGALEAYGHLYDIKEIRMTIFQPRREHVSQDVISVDDLCAWANDYVKPRAELAIKGEGEFSSGDWCRFCKLRYTCRKRADDAMRLACYEFKKAPELTNQEIAEALKTIPLYTKWAKDIEDYALEQALQGKATYDGFKLVRGRSVRKYQDPVAVENTLLDHGYGDIYQKKLLGLTDMEKKLGKEVFGELVLPLVHKPDGAPTLVPISDKRQELHLEATTEFERM